MKKWWIILYLFMVVIFTNLVLATPPTPPTCPDNITNIEYHKSIILQNAEIKKLGETFEIVNFNLQNCFWNGISIGDIIYKVPKDYSSSQIQYTFSLPIDYHKNQTLNVNLDETGKLNSTYIVNLVKNNIKNIEENRRMKEFIDKLNPNEGQLGIVRSINSIIHAGENNQYYAIHSEKEKGVEGFLLPNNINWENYPEIKLAHKIVEEDFLNKNISCSLVGRIFPGITKSSYYYNENMRWNLMVEVVDCKEGNWFREIYLKEIQLDGSYKEGYVSTMEINKSSESKMQYILLGIILLVIIIITILVIKRRKNK